MCLQSDTLLLADVFENFRNMGHEIYELHPAHFLFTPRLAWPAALKKTKEVLEQLTDIDMRLMVGKSVRCGFKDIKRFKVIICLAIHWQVKANNKYVRD